MPANTSLQQSPKNSRVIAKSAKEYFAFLQEVKGKVRKARLNAFRSANRVMIQLYWDIGKGIVERQTKFGWGKKIVEKLARDLRKEFSGQSGFSTQNLWYMRQFFLAYKDHPILQRFVGELPWGQNLEILAKAKTSAEKEFYLRETIRQGWTRDVLVHQIESNAHRSFSKRQHNFEKALPVHLSEQADRAVKDGYALDFLGSGKAVLERDLENQLVRHIRDLLVELGLGFCFIGNQYRIAANNREYFVDLLFFHRHLKCLVAVELKIGHFKPEYAGKMNFYLNLLDEHVKLKDENPSVGIILCKSKDRFEVEYALRGIHKPMGVAQYTLAQKTSKETGRRITNAAANKERPTRFTKLTGKLKTNSWTISAAGNTKFIFTLEPC